MSDINQIIAQSKPQFMKIADRNKLVRWEEECQFALQAVNGSAKLQECFSDTVQDAIINVAAVGLTLNPAHGYAYLVPEYDKGRQGQVCHLRVSFKGLIKLANDSGAVKWVRADVVYKNDHFVFNGAWEKPTHEIDPFGDRGDPIGVYCTVRTHDDDYLTEIAPWSEVLKAKAAAKTSYVWDQWLTEMAKKFIIKRASKQWPKTSGHLSEAIHVIDAYEGSAELNLMDKTAAEILNILYGDDYESDEQRAEAFDEVWDEMTDEEKQTIWTAKTKGGWFTQEDKKEIRRISHIAALMKRERIEHQPSDTLEQPLTEEQREWVDAYEGEEGARSASQE